MTDEKKAFRRNDRDGHLDPKHAASLREKSSHSKDDNKAFVGGHHTNDDLAEELAEGAVGAMTSGGDQLTDDFAADVPEELGGPFITTSASDELAGGTDESNPEGATREPFPKT